MLMTLRATPCEVEALADKQVKMIACGADHMCSTVIHSWVPDKEAEACMACKRDFTIARRRVSLLIITMVILIVTIYSTIVVNVVVFIVVHVQQRDILY